MQGNSQYRWCKKRRLSTAC